jgi:hypothetical protein
MGKNTHSKYYYHKAEARDDVVWVNPDGTFSEDRIFYNDPRNAEFKPWSLKDDPGVSYDEEAGIFTVREDVWRFDYKIESNGRYSEATVKILRPELEDENLLANGGFEKPRIPYGEKSLIVDSENDSYFAWDHATPVQIFKDGVNGIVTPDYGRQWVDTLGETGASPGIDISQDVNVKKGDWAQISLDVARQADMDADAKLEIHWRDKTFVIEQKDFGPGVAVGEFQKFTFNVKGGWGEETLRLLGTGGADTDTGNQEDRGFAINNVALREYEDHDHYYGGHKGHRGRDDDDDGHKYYRGRQDDDGAGGHNNNHHGNYHDMWDV